MQKLTSPADSPLIRVVFVTMDTHVASAVERARIRLSKQIPNLSLCVHAASEFSSDPQALSACIRDIERGDIIIATMLFMEDHFNSILPALAKRRSQCDAMVCALSTGEVTKLTRIGAFDMSAPANAAMALLKKLRGSGNKSASAGANQMKMLKRLPKILKFIPGTAQDVRAYFISLQYWLAGSEENMVNLVLHLVDRYADGPRRSLRGTLKAKPPVEYPETGLYHPRMASPIGEDISKVPVPEGGYKATIGLLLMRSYVLAQNAGHYDGMIHALEARGLRVIPAFAAGLDARPAIETYFMKNGQPVIDGLVSLMGFSLVGGPAYNDAQAAEDILTRLDVPYIAAHPVEFQTMEQWRESDRGLLPVESTIMVAIPELDGSTGPAIFGGRAEGGTSCGGCERKCSFPKSESARDMHVCAERAEILARRIEKLAILRRSERAKRKLALVIFNFPPNAGNTGTAAHLSVFESLFHVLKAMQTAGYQVDMPSSVEALRNAIIEGNAKRFGALANVFTRIPNEDHVRRETWLRDIESQWGPAPGKQQSDGSSIHILGERFGNIFIGVQPGFGYEGDPMRLLFEKGFAPTHAFSAFYRWLREDFGAHAVLHFGTHGALEFMPGKQAGLTNACWPDRLIADLPNFYLYASNNPSEGTIAKRRAGATLISYLTPPLSNAGLYRGLVDLKASLDRWRKDRPEDAQAYHDLAELIQAQAAELNLAPSQPKWSDQLEQEINKLNESILELEYALIPHGLHVVGQALSDDQRVDMLLSMAEATHNLRLDPAVMRGLMKGADIQALTTDKNIREILTVLKPSAEHLARNVEIQGLLKALDGRFVNPAPGGDLLRSPDILPTGRNLHGFDPFKIPSLFATQDGSRQAQRLLERHIADGNDFPETVAMVLWGTDNLKTEGAPIAQALALLGAAPRFDTYGRLAGAILLPLDQINHPRVDVVISLSGIFRDLMPLQIKLLAEAAYLAASADEPVERNFVRKHALAYIAEHGGDLESASLRVFGNADGAYGSNVNNLVESGNWQNEDELAETYTRRKGFAYGRAGKPLQQPQLLNSILKGVDLAYQNLDSVELGVTTIDTYFDTLGGVSRAVKRAKGSTAPIYIGDQTKGEGIVRTINEQVALETHTRMLNPKWYEGMLKHGYEGVRQIESHVTNTMGWSATTGQVEPWVYQRLTQTYLLDPEMRQRLASLNPTASVKIADRLIEAHQRGYWTPDPDLLLALQSAGEELEDRLEGVEIAA